MLAMRWKNASRLFGRSSGNNFLKWEVKPPLPRTERVLWPYRMANSEIICHSCKVRFRGRNIFGYCPECRAEHIRIYDADLALIRNEVKKVQILSARCVMPIQISCLLLKSFATKDKKFAELQKFQNLKLEQGTILCNRRKMFLSTLSVTKTYLFAVYSKKTSFHLRKQNISTTNISGGSPKMPIY